MYLVKDLYKQYGEVLDLRLITGSSGVKKGIKKPEVQRPGLSLTGYLKNVITDRIYIFGKIEIEYLKELPKDVCAKRLEGILDKKTPCVLVAHNHLPPGELIAACERKKIPLFRTSIPSMKLVNTMTVLLSERFLPFTTEHATLVEVFGIGVMIKGKSSIGKSEAALGLIERGHRLVSDDVVEVKKTKEGFLSGSSPELTRHMMEIRGIGIINVAHIYGAVCVRLDKRIEIVVMLEKWDDDHFYDRVGLEEKFCDILDVKLPYYILPVKPGRDVVLLIETIATNHRSKIDLGYHSAKEFNAKLLKEIEKRKI